MTQLWSTLLTFLFAHSQLGRWFTHVFDCLILFEDVLANPDEAPLAALGQQLLLAPGQGTAFIWEKGLQPATRLREAL